MPGKYATTNQEAVFHLRTIFELNPYLSYYHWMIVGCEDTILLQATVHNHAIATLAETVAYHLYGNQYKIINRIEINPDNVTLLPRSPLFHRMEDLNTLTTIRLKYDLNQYTHSSRVNLEVTSGNVIISGVVKDKMTKHFAEELAYDTFGIDKLIDRLVVDPAERQSLVSARSPYLKTPLSNLKIMLVLSKRFSSLPIYISQQGDAINLEGEVADELTKKRLENIALSVLGIRKVLTKGLSARHTVTI